MIDEGINNGTYVESDDITLEDLKHFQDFIKYNLKDHPQYKKLMPSSQRRNTSHS